MAWEPPFGCGTCCAILFGANSGAVGPPGCRHSPEPQGPTHPFHPSTMATAALPDSTTSKEPQWGRSTFLIPHPHSNGP